MRCSGAITLHGEVGDMLGHAELRRITPAEQIVSMPAMLQRRWTEAEVRQLIDEAPAPTPRYELVDGELLVTPSPSLVHQRIARELMLVLHAYVKAHGVGEVLFSPSDVRLARELVVQPDLYVVPRDDNGPQLTNTRITRLLLAIEIVSPSSARYDRVVKRHGQRRPLSRITTRPAATESS